MKPWEREHPEWYRASPKKPPPEHGIKVKKAGTTWWGQRWIEALESVLKGDAGRLGRGRSYARSGRTHDLAVLDGKVTAKVTGSRPTPYDVTIELTQLTASTWEQAISAMAEKAQFSAELLGGVMPKEIDEVFLGAGASLFPRNRAELHTECSCPDWGDPCKHVAATHYVLGEALDRDPFLLFELRGRKKGLVLAALRAARVRGGAERLSSAEPEAAAANALAPEVPSMSLSALAPGDYDRPREPLPTLHFSFDAPLSHGAVLQQLGAPAAWHGSNSPAEALAPLVRSAADAARRIALLEPEPEPETDTAAGSPVAAPQPSKRPRKAATRARRRPDGHK